MGRRDRDNDPILDANDVMWWAALSLLAVVPVLAWITFDLPWWGVLLVALLIGIAMTPLRRRYERQADAKRPRNQG